jgi:hypothetical protein
MKYLLTIHMNPAAFGVLSEDERNAVMAGHEAFIAELRETGEMAGTIALAEPSNLNTVRVRECAPRGVACHLQQVTAHGVQAVVPGHSLVGIQRREQVQASLRPRDHRQRDSYRTAARLTLSLPEQRYLEARAARLAGADH